MYINNGGVKNALAWYDSETKCKCQDSKKIVDKHNKYIEKLLNLENIWLTLFLNLKLFFL